MTWVWRTFIKQNSQAIVIDKSGIFERDVIHSKMLIGDIRFVDVGDIIRKVFLVGGCNGENIVVERFHFSIDSRSVAFYEVVLPQNIDADAKQK